jgi:hypothetical protein
MILEQQRLAIYLRTRDRQEYPREHFHEEVIELFVVPRAGELITVHNDPKSATYIVDVVEHVTKPGNSTYAFIYVYAYFLSADQIAAG